MKNEPTICVKCIHFIECGTMKHHKCNAFLTDSNINLVTGQEMGKAPKPCTTLNHGHCKKFKARPPESQSGDGPGPDLFHLNDANDL
jgi:hypothetical protein